MLNIIFHNYFKFWDSFGGLEGPLTPRFDCLEPSPLSKAVINLTTHEGLSHRLAPQDIPIVPEVTLTS